MRYMYFIILCSVVVSNCCYIVILNNVKNIFDSFFEILSLLILFVRCPTVIASLFLSGNICSKFKPPFFLEECKKLNGKITVKLYLQVYYTTPLPLKHTHTRAGQVYLRLRFFGQQFQDWSGPSHFQKMLRACPKRE